MADFKLSASQEAQAVSTLVTAWEMYFPSFAVPADRWLRSWLHFNPLSTVLAAFEFAAHEKYEHAEHCSKSITVLLKDVRYTT